MQELLEKITDRNSKKNYPPTQRQNGNLERKSDTYQSLVSLCHHLAHMAILSVHSGTPFIDMVKSIPDTCRHLSKPVFNGVSRTSVRTINNEVFVCTPVYIQPVTNPDQYPMIRLESGMILGEKFQIKTALLTESVLQMWIDNAFSQDIFSTVEIDISDIIPDLEIAVQSPLNYLFSRFITDGSLGGLPLVAALLMTRGYGNASVLDTEIRGVHSLYAEEWSRGQLSQIQGILADKSLAHSNMVNCIREMLSRFNELIEGGGADDNCMNFIAYSYLHMLLSGNPVDICHMTDNMPSALKADFQHLMQIRD